MNLTFQLIDPAGEALLLVHTPVPREAYADLTRRLLAIRELAPPPGGLPHRPHPGGRGAGGGGRRRLRRGGPPPGRLRLRRGPGDPPGAQGAGGGGRVAGGPPRPGQSPHRPGHPGLPPPPGAARPGRAGGPPPLPRGGVGAAKGGRTALGGRLDPRPPGPGPGDGAPGGRPAGLGLPGPEPGNRPVDRPGCRPHPPPPVCRRGAAAAAWQALRSREGRQTWPLRQPGGPLEVTTVTQGRQLKRLSVAGPVDLGPVYTVEF
mgnify:CR=1 FL=1